MSDTQSTPAAPRGPTAGETRAIVAVLARMHLGPVVLLPDGFAISPDPMTESPAPGPDPIVEAVRQAAEILGDDASDLYAALDDLVNQLDAARLGPHPRGLAESLERAHNALAASRGRRPGASRPSAAT